MLAKSPARLIHKSRHAIMSKHRRKLTLSTFVIQRKTEIMTYFEDLILRHGKRTIDKLCQECEYREEERNGLIFKYWKNKHGIDIRMLRSDGEGYIQLCNQDGEAFGGIMINKNSEDVSYVVSIPGLVDSMKWFMAYN